MASWLAESLTRPGRPSKLPVVVAMSAWAATATVGGAAYAMWSHCGGLADLAVFSWGDSDRPVGAQSS